MLLCRPFATPLSPVLRPTRESTPGSRPKPIPGKSLGSPRAHSDLWTAFGHYHRIHRQFLLFRVEPELKAVGEQFLNHELHLIPVGLTGNVGLPDGVISLGIQPRR